MIQSSFSQSQTRTPPARVQLREGWFHGIGRLVEIISDDFSDGKGDFATLQSIRVISLLSLGDGSLDQSVYEISYGGNVGNPDFNQSARSASSSGTPASSFAIVGTIKKQIAFCRRAALYTVRIRIAKRRISYCK